ncbi:MAG: ABC transporter permease [Bacillota bacterium]|nr:ABC transporter permease [Bacillota bacterium]
MGERWRQWIKTYRAPAGFCLAMLFLWETAVRGLDVPAFILPPPSAIAVALWEHADVLWTVHLPATLSIVALGLLISVIVGVAMAALMTLFPLAERTFYPLLIVSQTLPIIALAPVFILWFGYSVWGKVAVTVLISFFPIVVNTYDGFRRADSEWMDLLRVMGANRWQIFLKAQVPAALPMFFSGLKMAAVVSVIGATIGEWLGANEGLGYFSRRMAHSVRAAPLFAAIFVLSLLGIGLFLLIQWLERQAMPWKRESGRKEEAALLDKPMGG